MLKQLPGPPVGVCALESETGQAEGSGPARTGERETALLVERARRDPSAFALLYEGHYSRVLSYAYRCTLDMGAAEEVTSNSFFNALRALDSYDGNGTFRGWLYRIATNEVRQHWRRQRRAANGLRQCAEDLARVRFEACRQDDPAEREKRLACFARLHQVLMALPAKYRAAVCLRYFEDLPYQEVAQALGKKVGTVKSLVHRGLALMRQRMGRDSATFS